MRALVGLAHLGGQSIAEVTSDAGRRRGGPGSEHCGSQLVTAIASTRGPSCKWQLLIRAMADRTRARRRDGLPHSLSLDGRWKIVTAGAYPIDQASL